MDAARPGRRYGAGRGLFVAVHARLIDPSDLIQLIVHATTAARTRNVPSIRRRPPLTSRCVNITRPRFGVTPELANNSRPGGGGARLVTKRLRRIQRGCGDGAIPGVPGPGTGVGKKYPALVKLRAPPGPNSCPSSPSKAKYARSSAPRTLSRASTPESARPSAPADTSLNEAAALGRVRQGVDECGFDGQGPQAKGCCAERCPRTRFRSPLRVVSPRPTTASQQPGSAVEIDVPSCSTDPNDVQFHDVMFRGLSR